MKAPNGETFEFTLPQLRRDMLLRGADEVAYTLSREAEITRYQERVAAERPWEMDSFER